MSGVTGAISQAIITQMNASMGMMKKQAEAQQGLIEMIAASADTLRGQTLDIAV